MAGGWVLCKDALIVAFGVIAVCICTTTVVMRLISGEAAGGGHGRTAVAARTLVATAHGRNVQGRMKRSSSSLNWPRDID